MARKFCAFYLAFFLSLAGAATAGSRPEKTIRITSPTFPFETDKETLEISGQVLVRGSIQINSIRLPVKPSQDFWLILPLKTWGRQSFWLEIYGEDSDLLERLELPVLRWRTFPDVAGHWAQPEIETVSTLGLMGNYRQTGLFLPEYPLSRAEMAVLLVTAAGLPVGHDSGNSPAGNFSDVLPVYWARAQIRAAAQAGLIDSPVEGKFLPDGLITKNEAVVWLCRLAKLPPRPVKTFWSLGEPYCSAGYLEAAQQAGLWIKEWRRESFQPLAPFTRAEAAVLFSRLEPVMKRAKALKDFNGRLEISPVQAVGSYGPDKEATIEVRVTQSQGLLDPSSVRICLPLSRRALPPQQQVILPQGGLFTFPGGLPAEEAAAAYIMAADQLGRIQVLPLVCFRPEEETPPAVALDLSVPDLFLDWPVPVYLLAEREAGFYSSVRAGWLFQLGKKLGRGSGLNGSSQVK